MTFKFPVYWTNSIEHPECILFYWTQWVTVLSSSKKHAWEVALATSFDKQKGTICVCLKDMASSYHNQSCFRELLSYTKVYTVNQYKVHKDRRTALAISSLEPWPQLEHGTITNLSHWLWEFCQSCIQAKYNVSCIFIKLFKGTQCTNSISMKWYKYYNFAWNTLEIPKHAAMANGILSKNKWFSAQLSSVSQGQPNSWWDKCSHHQSSIDKIFWNTATNILYGLHDKMTELGSEEKKI